MTGAERRFDSSGPTVTLTPTSRRHPSYTPPQASESHRYDQSRWGQGLRQDSFLGPYVDSVGASHKGLSLDLWGICRVVFP